MSTKSNRIGRRAERAVERRLSRKVRRVTNGDSGATGGLMEAAATIIAVCTAYKMVRDVVKL